MTPGCARSVRLRGSTSRIAFICARHSTIAPSLGTLPPLSPVPDPRVTTGTPADAASCTHRDTSSVVRGNTTASGRCLSAAVPSNPYGITSSGFVRTRVGPTMPLRRSSMMEERDIFAGSAPP